MNNPTPSPATAVECPDGVYVLFAEGGGWPDHCVGPFFDYDTAEEYIATDKWRESWGSVSHDPRDLPVHVPNDECAGCGTPIFRDRHGTYIDMTGGDACGNRHHQPRPAADVPAPPAPAVETNRRAPTDAEREPAETTTQHAPARFELDTDAARAALTEAADNEELSLSSECPGSDIERLFDDLSEHLVCPPGYHPYHLGIYVLIYAYSPDGVLLVVRRPHPLPALADGPWDWDDLAPRSALDRALTIDQAVGIVKRIIRHANELLARADQPEER